MFVADPAVPPTDVFVYTLQPTRLAMMTEGATDAEKALAAQHWKYSVDLQAKNVVLFAGRTLDTSPETFALCVIRARSQAEAQAVMDGDPAVKGGVFRARLFRFQPMLIGDYTPA
jgi:uncharacterized protein